jgi:hypothetical protein
MSIDRILTVSLLYQLPEDVLNVIKDFAFYDIGTWTIIQRAREAKLQAMERIRHAVTKYTLEEDETNEMWCFMCYVHLNERTQMQASNCSTCGNYKHFGYLPETIVCRCQVEEEQEYLINNHSLNDLYDINGLLWNDPDEYDNDDNYFEYGNAFGINEADW